jgi:hypothetical protein
MPKSVMVQIVSSFVVVLSVIHQVQSFKLQRAFQLRPHTVLFSGDAVEKLNLEPIARIAGEVRLLSQYLRYDETSVIIFCNVTNVLPIVMQITLPGSKSLSNRVLLLSALSKGTTTVENLLDSADIRYMLGALKQLNVKSSICLRHIDCFQIVLFFEDLKSI